MKKSLVLLAGLMSASVFAAGGAQPQIQAQPAQQNQPMIKLGVYDLSTNVPKDLGQTYSLSKKNQALCWTAFNMPFSETNQNQVTQTITAPNNKAKFIAPGAAITTSPDGKTTTITNMMASYNNEFLQFCWTLDKTDPRGQYTIAIQINDVKFGTLNYKVVK